MFRALIRESPTGLPAGELAAALDTPANTLSFHLKELSHAQLVTSRREGRSVVYSIANPAVKELLAYLVEDCCQGRPELCETKPGICC